MLINIRNCGRSMLGLAVALSLTPNVAFASAELGITPEITSGSVAQVTIESTRPSSQLTLDEIVEQLEEAAEKSVSSASANSNEKSSSKSSTKANKKDSSKKSAKSGKKSSSSKTDKILKYDRKLIEKVGTQEKTGHTICCPSFSCAYGDVVLDGTVNSHEYYTCSCCTWTDWGGGGSSNRCVGNDEELLREAYEQIKKGKPTVIHVAGASGEHWICLIGYQNAKDPDHLNLSNFIALDPWDGAQITATDRYTLYGDGCEHVSDR